MKRGGWHRRRLLIFVKEPVAGRVKTRLGRDVGMVSAAWWFRHRARALTRELARDPRWETWLAVSPDRAGLESRFWPSGPGRWAQGRGDLGARMGRAFRSFAPGPLVIVGADIPGVDRARVWAAFRALGAAEAATGPAEDGGYWLIGLKRVPRRAPAGLFSGVRWSTATALADTERSLAGLRIARVDRLRDVDRAADLPGAIP